MHVSEAGVEGLSSWQAAVGKAAAGNAAGVQVTTYVAAAERTTAGNAIMSPGVAAVVSPASTEMAVGVQTAAAKPAVGSKRTVPSILTLLIARVSSEVDPVGTQGDGKPRRNQPRGA